MWSGEVALGPGFLLSTFLREANPHGSVGSAWRAKVVGTSCGTEGAHGAGASQGICLYVLGVL